MRYHTSEIKHEYGPNVHVLSDPCLTTWLARLCSPETKQPEINSLVELLYSNLLQNVVAREFLTRNVQQATRMTASHPEALLNATVLETEQRAICVNLARAGTVPSHVCYNLLNRLINPDLVRQDHVLASRLTDAESKVTGTHLSGAKIGGDVHDAFVLLPDPMGATGNTIVSALSHYKKSVGGKAKKYLALHLIVTPEYLKNVLTAHPDLIIYALRVDRGLSPEDVLNEVPGVHWERERGLNQNHYIVPGGGGFGEIMNNSFV